MLRIVTLIILALFALPAHALETKDLKGKLPDDRVLGKPGAKVTLIEYASLSCPHCAAFHNDILPALQKDYIDTGKVRLIFRDFPLNEPAFAGSKVAHCIGKQGDAAYYAALKTLFAAQKDWAFGKDFQPKLAEIAKSAGVDKTALNSCLTDKQLEAGILTTRKDAAEKLGINSTPSFLVNGEKAEFHSVDDARKALDTVLSGKSLGQEKREAAKKAAVARPGDMVLGQEKAKVTVVEYSSFSTCPHCGAYHKNLISALKPHIDAGKVKVVYRGLPMNSAAFYAYMLPYCKGNAEAFSVLSLLADEVQSWGATPAFLTPLRTVAQKAGLSHEQFNSCLANAEVEKLILANAREAAEIGVAGSPYVFVNGEPVTQTEDPQAVVNAVEATLKSGK